MITIPTLQQLYTSIKTDLESSYGATIPLLGKSVIRTIAIVQAGKLKLYYLAIGNLQKNIFVDTAESESVGGTLERFGRVKLGRDPYQSVAGQYILTVTGTIGGVIKASTTFKSNDTALSPGFLFILDEEYTLIATTDTITVRALTSGETSKLNIGDQLTATSPIALVDSLVTVDSVYVEALAAEDIEDYRTAIINSYRLETQGGSATDYRLWAQDAQGVRYVYPYAKTGYANEINLFVEATAADSTDGKGTPSASLLADVEEVIELDPDTTLDILERGRRPLGVFEVHYIPVTIMEIDITITGAVSFTTEIKALILTALTDAIESVRPFVAAADVLENKNDILDTNKLIGIIIQANPGAIFTSVSFTVDSVPVSTITFTDGDIPNFNSVTYL